MLVISLLQLVVAPCADPPAILFADMFESVFACDAATITSTVVKQLVDMCLGCPPRLLHAGGMHCTFLCCLAVYSLLHNRLCCNHHKRISEFEAPHQKQAELLGIDQIAGMSSYTSDRTTRH
jgi:hypothetical protein